MTTAVAAVDLGATSGRVILGHVSANELSIRPVARFPNTPVRTIDGLHWNILELYRSVVAGLGAAAREEPAIASIGIDSWAVDYALLRNGRMLGVPYHYRDERNNAAVEAVHGLVTPPELYAANGLQFLPFNSLYQLTADRLAGSLDAADGVLLVPDLLGYWLTGRKVAERTNASTTGLVNIATGEWDAALLRRLQLPASLFPELVDAGTRIGPLLDDVAREIGIDPATGVTAVGSHDTASAVLAVPAQTEDFAYISCGTWGLVGVELERPELSEAGRLANFTNEGGVDGTVRYLHNVMGLWLLSESVREWERGATPISLPALLAAASAVTVPVAVFDANDPRFLTPGDMPARIAEWCRENGAVVPGSQAEFVRSIIESLAAAFVDAVRTASSLSGKRVSVIHIVGGGSQNELLCQLIADRSGLPVQAGPVEATAIGNVLVQARAAGLVDGSRAAMRALVAAAFEVRTYTPQAL
ncbi:rhamnulokinase [Conyzicola lurida]|uniref:Rhamnulokinase n=1 Tax=Conyzicola lurida TaxID=1172621 RepID=A0A841ALE1_9MICO|nr:rhamnulokinase family protein [Conyzicola lurida]MBB5844790.1 rhamnulokinase [Conyzicola lurida]